MRLITYQSDGGSRLGAVRGDTVFDLGCLASLGDQSDLPETMQALIEAGPAALARLGGLMDSRTEAEWEQAGATCFLASIQLLAPLPRPRKNVICLGRNYVEHAREISRARGESDTLPPAPLFFTKVATAVIGPEAPILIHPVSAQMDWEVELAVIIGRAGRDIPAADALDHVFGYTILNDVSARDIQYGHGGQYFKGKSLDNSCPFGPWIVTADELPNPHDLALRLWVNGALKQEGHTGDMIHEIPMIIAVLSAGMTLEPGDIIATGTPAGVGHGRTPREYLRPGDVVEVEIEAIGRMRNPVALAQR